MNAKNVRSYLGYLALSAVFCTALGLLGASLPFLVPSDAGFDRSKALDRQLEDHPEYFEESPSGSGR